MARRRRREERKGDPRGGGVARERRQVRAVRESDAEARAQRGVRVVGGGVASTQVPAAGAEQMRDARDEARGVLGVQRVGVDDGGASAAARDREARGGEDRAQRTCDDILRLAAEVAREGGVGGEGGPVRSIPGCDEIADAEQRVCGMARHAQEASRDGEEGREVHPAHDAERGGAGVHRLGGEGRGEAQSG